MTGSERSTVRRLNTDCDPRGPRSRIEIDQTETDGDRAIDGLHRVRLHAPKPTNQTPRVNGTDLIE